MQRIATWLLCTVVFLAACQKDEAVVEPSGRPQLLISSSNAADKVTSPNEPFITLLSARRGGAKLRGVAVYENNKLLDLNLFKVNNLAVLGNPFFLYAPDDENASIRVEINSPNKTGKAIYSFVLTDYSGQKDSVARNIIVESKAPILKFNGPDLTISTFNKEAKFKLNGIKGTGKMVTIAVLQDSVPVAASRMTWGTTKVTSNPFTLDVTDGSVFDKDLTILSQNEAKTIVYTFTVVDDFGAKATDRARVLVGTPVTELVNKELYNASRNGAFGGMILASGKSVASTDVQADIIDIGIDSTASKATNWRKQVRTAPNVDMRRIIIGTNGIVQTFTYAGIFTQEQIADLHSKGVKFTQTDSQKRPISESLQVGYIYVVKKDNVYYLVEVVGVVLTPDDDNDYVRLNIKQ